MSKKALAWWMQLADRSSLATPATLLEGSESMLASLSPQNRLWPTLPSRTQTHPRSQGDPPARWNFVHLSAKPTRLSQAVAWHR